MGSPRNHVQKNTGLGTADLAAASVPVRYRNYEEVARIKRILCSCFTPELRVKMFYVFGFCCTESAVVLIR